MGSTGLSNNQWVDIIPPAAPPENLLVTGLPVLLVLALMVFVYLFWYRRPVNRARRAIYRLRRNRQGSSGNRRLYALEINRQLCRGLQVTRLDAVDAGSQAQAWETFRRDLSESCYARLTLEQVKLDALSETACYWLRQLSNTGRRSKHTLTGSWSGR